MHLGIALDDAILQAHRQAVLDGKVQLHAKHAVKPQLTPLVQGILAQGLPCTPQPY